MGERLLPSSEGESIFRLMTFGCSSISVALLAIKYSCLFSLAIIFISLTGKKLSMSPGVLLRLNFVKDAAEFAIVFSDPGFD